MPVFGLSTSPFKYPEPDSEIVISAIDPALFTTTVATAPEPFPPLRITSS